MAWQHDLLQLLFLGVHLLMLYWQIAKSHSFPCTSAVMPAVSRKPLVEFDQSKSRPLLLKGTPTLSLNTTFGFGEIGTP